VLLVGASRIASIKVIKANICNWSKSLQDSLIFEPSWVKNLNNLSKVPEVIRLEWLCPPSVKHISL
jgi:hypothetical protein